MKRDIRLNDFLVLTLLFNFWGVVDKYINIFDIKVQNILWNCTALFRMPNLTL